MTRFPVKIEEAQKLDARIFDMSSGKFIEDTGEKSFKEWKELVDTIIDQKFKARG